jgi:hypothetical protein
MKLSNVNSSVPLHLFSWQLSNRKVKTISEIRRDNLLKFIEKQGRGSVANLNVKIGLARTDATLTQIKNQNPNSGTGKPRGMGDPLARRIERALDLPAGYMDNVNTFEDPRMEERLQHLHKVAEGLGAYELDQLIKIGAALAQPTSDGNGTTG